MTMSQVMLNKAFCFIIILVGGWEGEDLRVKPFCHKMYNALSLYKTIY